MHISNRIFDLRPVIARLARELGLSMVIRGDRHLTKEQQADGHSPSLWVALAKEREPLERLALSDRWSWVTSGTTRRVWTDDYSNILSVFVFFEH